MASPSKPSKPVDPRAALNALADALAPLIAARLRSPEYAKAANRRWADPTYRKTQTEAIRRRITARREEA